MHGYFSLSTYDLVIFVSNFSLILQKKKTKILSVNKHLAQKSDIISSSTDL